MNMKVLMKEVVFLLLLESSYQMTVKNDNKIVNMNGEYLISNPDTTAPTPWTSDYSKFDGVEFFDAYSPAISTKYGEVFWTMMDPVPLDEALVARFKGHTMAVVGYETNQVMKTPEGDVSVPITWAYNHHFCAYLSGSYSEMKKVEQGEMGDLGMANHGAAGAYMTLRKEGVVDTNPGAEVPTSQFISEGNGGEFRKSYHGYPK